MTDGADRNEGRKGDKVTDLTAAVQNVINVKDGSVLGFTDVYLEGAAVFDAWNELWVDAALAHDRFMRIDVTKRRDRGDAHWAWRFR